MPADRVMLVIRFRLLPVREVVAVPSTSEKSMDASFSVVSSGSVTVSGIITVSP